MVEADTSIFFNTAPILTMHGADGCGKTTISNTLQEVMGKDQEVLLIGSSDFKEWLTPAIYEDFIGSTINFYNGISTNATPEQKVKFYEDITICLFGISERFARNRGPVIVHSDPFLKRLIWAYKSMTTDQFDEYTSYFDSYVSSYIGDTYASHLVELIVDPKESFDRINRRGINSEYDPQSEEENMRIYEAARSIGDLIINEYSEREIQRFKGIKYKVIKNPKCSLGTLEEQKKAIADEIQDFWIGYRYGL